jgi:hypothetical protein
LPNQRFKRPDLATMDRVRFKRILVVFVVCALLWAAAVYVLLRVL